LLLYSLNKIIVFKDSSCITVLRLANVTLGFQVGVEMLAFVKGEKPKNSDKTFGVWTKLKTNSKVTHIWSEASALQS